MAASLSAPAARSGRRGGGARANRKTGAGSGGNATGNGSGARRNRRNREAKGGLLPPETAELLSRRATEGIGLLFGALAALLLLALATYTPIDPSWNTAGGTGEYHNLLGAWGAYPADLLVQLFGVVSFLFCVILTAWAWRLIRRGTMGRAWVRLLAAMIALALFAAAVTPLANTPFALTNWAAAGMPGGAVGVIVLDSVMSLAGDMGVTAGRGMTAAVLAVLGVLTILLAFGLSWGEWGLLGRQTARGSQVAGVAVGKAAGRTAKLTVAAGRAAQRTLRRREGPHTGTEDETPAVRKTPKAAKPRSGDEAATAEEAPATADRTDTPAPRPRTKESADATAATEDALGAAIGAAPKPVAAGSGGASASIGQDILSLGGDTTYELPPYALLSLPSTEERAEVLTKEALSETAASLESVLSDFGVKGQIVKVNPGPVVTLFELEPAPGTKSSRVIGLSDDIARSMGAVSVRVAVVPGKNAMGIELPNPGRETVYLRELLESRAAEQTSAKLALMFGRDIGGDPVIADLARMPHLLVAGTTGSGKSVAINTMILSLLYRMPPERVRFIMIDPKMLELSVYDDIPHLLSPVVTDPKKAVVALKWTVREMEDRYRGMSRMGVRNVEGYNQKLRDARERGETLMRRVQTGFDPDTGKPVFEDQPMDMTELPYIVVVVDEMADLMLVAGKEIEGAIQRLAQMARAAGIHIIMATQRPSVDVITGTIKANFPTRISFQVTSKIDSRTILGEGGAEQLLGQGDMLYMAGGGRITRVHGPFVSDYEVEQVVAHLKRQGEPAYNDTVLEEADDDGGGIGGGGGGGDGAGSGSGSGNELYDKAVDLVARERKASTSFIQRHLQIGYNRAATIIEEMERNGVVSSANHVGKREVLVRDPNE
ncbi:DNA translocase FtsK [Fodinicurvata sp. EGI_FJ10296]|uniref:DNA translocase FtsK n=1 Tax=Fodinicurvata sp. EGI_FJ10296 TaxID=3231908 RepID=UPI00345424D1